MERFVRYIIVCRSHETASPPAGGSRIPAPNEMKMKDVLFHNFFGKKGHKTTSVVPPSWSPAPNKLRSRNILTPNNNRGTTSRGACDEGNLNNIARRTL
jgi:hypothetical protein